MDVVALVNISTENWPPRHRTYFGSLAISSPQPGEAFAVTPIRGCLGVMDLGDKRTMEYRITAREIAEDLAREINGDSGEGSYHGVFVAAGDAPTESELADARRRLEGGGAQQSPVHHRPRAPRRAPTRAREALALRRPPARRMSRLRGKNQARRGRVPLLRRHPRPRKGRAIRPRRRQRKRFAAQPQISHREA